MICKFCGGNVTKNNKFCSHCGANLKEEEKVIEEPVQVPAAEANEKKETPVQKKVNGFGIAGMVLGIVSMCFTSLWFSAILSTLGIVFSSISMSQFKSGKYKLKGFHIAGLVISIIVLSGCILGFIFQLTIIPYFYNIYGTSIA